MLNRILRDDAIRILMPRAAVMWLLVRLAFLAVAVVAPTGPTDAFAPPPAGIVLLAAFLSVAEWRRRSESAFWRNFGVSLHSMAAIALAAAVVGEILLYTVVRYVIPHG